MSHWLEKIRSKPEPERIRIIWIICGTIAALFVVLWIITAVVTTSPTSDSSNGSIKKIFEIFSNFKR